MGRAWVFLFGMACAAEAGPPGPQGEPGPQGPQGSPGEGLGVIEGGVSCAQNTGDITTTVETVFFSSGWTYTSATLVTPSDDHSQGAFDPPGLDPQFVFLGSPDLVGLIVCTVSLSERAMIWTQGGNEINYAGWGSDACVDTR